MCDAQTAGKVVQDAKAFFVRLVKKDSGGNVAAPTAGDYDIASGQAEVYFRDFNGPQCADTVGAAGVADRGTVHLVGVALDGPAFDPVCTDEDRPHARGWFEVYFGESRIGADFDGPLLQRHAGLRRLRLNSTWAGYLASCQLVI